MSKRKNRGAARPAQETQTIEAADVAPVETVLEVPTTSLAAAAPAAAAAEIAPKKTRGHRPAGLGHPDAKKLVNPQHTLELKKEAAAKLGGKMEWTNKNWKVTVPAGEFTLQSREMAALSVATFLEKVTTPAKALAKEEAQPEQVAEA